MPNKQVDPAIITSTVIRVLRRPILSANGPKNSPPKGRIKKLKANAAKLLSRLVVGSSETKNAWPIYTARKPYTP
ncbi:hypothetical protein D3C84_1113890 [compost metagenome]